MSGLSDLDAAAEGEGDAAVSVNRRVIQQHSSGLRIEFHHLLRQSAQCIYELLHSGLGGIRAAYSIASIQQAISILERSIPNDRYGHSCVVQGLQDLDQALDFLEDINHPKKKLERCDGFDDGFFYIKI